MPVNGASAPTASALQTYLNGIYKQANVDFTVTTKTDFSFNLDSMGVAGLERAGDGLNKYSSEMRILRDKFAKNNPTYDKDASYIFVVPTFEPDPTGGNIEGFMPRGRSMGFVVSGANIRTYAHELGHGAFGLEHTFPDILKGSTNNLMDYGSGTHLTHKQWDAIEKNKFVWSWRDEEEDGALGGLFKRKMTIYLHPYEANNPINAQLPQIAEIVKDIIRGNGNDNIIGDKVRGYFDIRVEINNTVLGDLTKDVLKNKANTQPTDCHLTVIEGVGGKYVNGGTLPYEVYSDIVCFDNIPATRSSVYVSPVDANPTINFGADKDSAYVIKTDYIQRHATAFGIAHELWHQLLIKAVHYLARSNKVMPNLPATPANITARESYLKSVLYDDIGGLHYDEGIEANLSMSRDKLNNYGGLPHRRFYYKGTLNSPDERKCLKILSAQYELYYEFMSRAYGTRP